MKLSPEDVANSVLLLRDTTAGPILLIEGPSDARLVERLIGSDSILTVVTEGKPVVLQAVDLLHAYGASGFLALVDQDFDPLRSVSLPPDVVHWDHHDLEMTVLHSEAAGAVTTYMCSSEKLSRFLSHQGASNLSEALMSLARPIGALRWISERDGLMLEFDAIKWDRFVDDKTLEVNVQGITGACLQMKYGTQARMQSLLSEIDSLVGGGIPSSLLCRGHDVMMLLARGLKRCIGSHGNSAPSTELVEAAMYAAFTYDMFSLTDLHSAIRDWEQQNLPLRILPRCTSRGAILTVSTGACCG